MLDTSSMALFIRKQDNENFLIKRIRNTPGISEGPADDGFMQLIVGLGNVGKEYDGTRHNIGFAAIDTYRVENGFPDWQEKAKFKALISEDFVGGKKVILAKPTTFMNLSGESINALKDFYKLSNNDIIVIHDELDLPFTTVKEKQGGGSAGNNGLKSLISHIGEDFKRIRIGVKNELIDQMDAADFVLSKFSAAEKKQLPEIIKAAIDKI